MTAEMPSRQLRLGDVAEIDRRAIAPSEIVEGTPFVGLEHITGKRGLVAVKPVRAGELGSPKFTFDSEHVLYGKLRPYLRKVARPSFAGVCSTDILPIRPGPEIDRNFLFHYLRSNAVVELASRRSSGANLPRLSPSALLDFRIRLPSLTEQHRIAAILDKADGLWRKHERSLYIADTLLRSAFLDMFGDPVLNSKRWQEQTIGKVALVITGNTPARLRLEYYGGDIEWIKSDNINTPQHIATRSEERLSEVGIKVGRIADPGSTLMTCIAGSPSCIGNVALTDRRVAFNQQINAITPGESLDSAFLYVQLLLSKPLIQRVSTGSMKGMVSKGRLSSVKMPLPPLDLQRRFGRWFTTFLLLKSSLERATHEAEHLFGSLSCRFFEERNT